MKKHDVSELTTKSKELFEYLAEQQGFRQRKISFYLDGEIDELEEVKVELGFRVCENPECCQIYNEGFLTEDSDTFCSSECAEKIVPSIVEDDYGDYIFFTDWEPES